MGASDIIFSSVSNFIFGLILGFFVGYIVGKVTHKKLNEDNSLIVVIVCVGWLASVIADILIVEYITPQWVHILMGGVVSIIAKFNITDLIKK